ncbi:MAG: aminopeptidase [Muribaculaceae bacterium]|nr:aminopeptidase [Muribaculaceae bacterium]
MNRLFLAFLACSMAVCAWADDPKIIIPDSTGFKFTDVKVIKTTPVKDQYKSGTCWCYSTNTFFEDEILRKTGDEIHLSEAFVVWHCYMDKAIKYIRMDGKINFAQGGSSMDVPYVWGHYGMVPNDVYTGLTYGDKKFNHSEIADAMSGYVNVINKNQRKKLTPAWIEGFKGLLNAYFGTLPEKFTWKGKEYTPKEFAKSLPINLDDYICITSFTHHPFYEPFIMEVADNWLWEKCMNVKMDEMKAVVDNAVDKGYPVEWAADISEPGFKFRKGYALLLKEKDGSDLTGSDRARWEQLSDKDREAEKWEVKGPVKELEVTQESRQAGFDEKETTDDHGMVIVGKAVDQEGNRYYKVQNSWDTNQLYGGFFYVSEAYFLAKTINVLVNKETVPANIAKKIGL